SEGAPGGVDTTASACVLVFTFALGSPNGCRIAPSCPKLYAGWAGFRCDALCYRRLRQSPASDHRPARPISSRIEFGTKSPHSAGGELAHGIWGLKSTGRGAAEPALWSRLAVSVNRFGRF